jgi:hypothetical protein
MGEVIDVCTILVGKHKKESSLEECKQEGRMVLNKS